MNRTTQAVLGTVIVGGALAAVVVLSPMSTTTDEGTAAPTATATSSAPAILQAGAVTYVVDGDTLDVAGAGRVRMAGVDTPERGQCGYVEAKAELSKLVLGKQVTLTRSGSNRSGTDRYGRLIRYVDIADSAQDVGLELVAEGFAIARYDSRDGYGKHTREAQYVVADSLAPPFCLAS